MDEPTTGAAFEPRHAVTYTMTPDGPKPAEGQVITEPRGEYRAEPAPGAQLAAAPAAPAAEASPAAPAAEAGPTSPQPGAPAPEALDQKPAEPPADPLAQPSGEKPLFIVRDDEDDAIDG